MQLTTNISTRTIDMSIIDSWSNEDEQAAYYHSAEHRDKIDYDLKTIRDIHAIIIKRGMKENDSIVQAVMRRLNSLEAMLQIPTE